MTPGLDQSTGTGGKSLTQYSCVYKQATALNPNGSVSAVDWVYFTGDIKFPTA